MSLELIAAGTLLDMALGGIVGDAASEGAKLLWQTIRNRLAKNQPVIEGEILELEQNPILENFKALEALLQEEMDKDRAFAEEISKLGKEIAQASGDTIEMKDFKAKNVIGKAEGNLFFGGTHNHEKK